MNKARSPDSRTAGFTSARYFFVLGFFLIFSRFAFTENLILDYQEGVIEKKTPSSGWQELYIGDELAVDSTIRISENGYAEFSLGDLKITVKEDGTYLLRDLVAASKQVSSWGLGNLVAGKIRNALKSSGGGQTAVMGVRGAAAGSEGQVEWVEAGTNADLLKEGMAHLDTARYREALEVFNEGLASSFGEEEQVFLFYIGYTHSLQGSTALALNTLQMVEVDPHSSYYPDLVLVRGRLLIETLSFKEALRLFESHIRKYPQGDLTQAVLLLSSYCYRGLEDTFQALQVLQQAYEMNPNSELGKEAQRIMQEM